jgi:hypothetical protein
MKWLEKVFNDFHMTGIENKYDSCAKDIGDAVKYTEDLSTFISESYDGQAKPMIEDTILKIREHLLLLQSCHTNAARFVKYTGKQMRSWDERTSL